MQPAPRIQRRLQSAKLSSASVQSSSSAPPSSSLSVQKPRSSGLPPTKPTGSGSAAECSDLCRPAERWPASLQEKSPERSGLLISAAKGLRNGVASPSTARDVSPLQGSLTEPYFRMIPIADSEASHHVRIVSKYLEGVLAELKADAVVRALLRERGLSTDSLSTIVSMEPTEAFRIESTAVDAMRPWQGMIVKKVLPMAKGDESRLGESGGRLCCEGHTQTLLPGLHGFYFSNIFKQEADFTGAGAEAQHIVRALAKGVATAVSGQRPGGDRVEAVEGRLMLCCLHVGRLSMNQQSVVDALRTEAGRVSNLAHVTVASQCARMKEALHKQFGADSVSVSIDGTPATVLFATEDIAPTHVVTFKCFTSAVRQQVNPSVATRCPETVGSFTTDMPADTLSADQSVRRPATAGPSVCGSPWRGLEGKSGRAGTPRSPESCAREIRQSMLLVSNQVRQQFKDIIDSAAAKRDAMLVLLQQEEDRLISLARSPAGLLLDITSQISALRIETIEVLREINRLHIKGLGLGAQQVRGGAAGSGASAIPRPGTAALLTPSQRRALGIASAEDDVPMVTAPHVVVHRPATSAAMRDGNSSRPPRPGSGAIGNDVMVSASQRGSAGPRQLMASGIPRPSTSSGKQRGVIM